MSYDEIVITMKEKIFTSASIVSRMTMQIKWGSQPMAVFKEK